MLNADKSVQWLLAPYDAASRYPGTSQSLDSWRKILSIDTPKCLDRLDGEVFGASLFSYVVQALSDDKVPFILGGDHSLTFHAVAAIYSKIGKVNVVHFDAHHDNYNEPRLTNYSVFHRLSRRFDISVIGLGYRFDSMPEPPSLASPILGPTYLSIDLDYFSPDLIPSVNHPVPCIADRHCDLSSFESSLAMISGPIVGIDVVEWRGSEPNTHEYETVCSILRLCRERLTTT